MKHEVIFKLCAIALCILFSLSDAGQAKRKGKKKGNRLERDIHLLHTNEFASLSTYKTGSCPFDTRSVAGGWRYRTSKYSSDKLPLLWVNSREGLLSHYFQAEKLWRIVTLTHRRPLVIAPFTSYRHYGATIMRLCDYFVFPKDVLCTALKRSKGFLTHPPSCKCKILTASNFSLKPQYSVFRDSHYFNLSAPDIIESANFAEEQCLAGFIDMHNGYPEPPPFDIDTHSTYPFNTVKGVPVATALLNITSPVDNSVLRNITVPIFPVTAISRKYMDLVPVLRAALGVEGVGLTLPELEKLQPFITTAEIDTGNDNTHSGTMLTVVHWRRGDYLQGNNSRCARRLDVSANCNTTEEFIVEVRRKVKEYGIDRRIRKNVIYVATNEGDDSSLAMLRRAGFKVKADLLRGLRRIVAAENKALKLDGKASQPNIQLSDVFPLSLPLTPADDFAIDIALVCTAEDHIHFGYSNYNKFINRCRPKKGKYHKPKMVVSGGSGGKKGREGKSGRGVGSLRGTKAAGRGKRGGGKS